MHRRYSIPAVRWISMASIATRGCRRMRRGLGKLWGVSTTMIAHESERTRHRLLRQRYLVLLIALLLLFALYPFIDQEVTEVQHVSLFFTVILIAGSYAVSHSRRFLTAAIVLAAGMLRAQWVVL